MRIGFREPGARRAGREGTLARSCDICGKGPMHGHRISHAHNVSSRVWYPNVQKVRVVVGRSRRRMRVCTRCLRRGAVVKAAS
ncbi:MAG: 50S ribosomal protein L28 [Acidobacteriota bacterium]